VPHGAFIFQSVSHQLHHFILKYPYESGKISQLVVVLITDFLKCSACYRANIIVPILNYF
jgi:hypothetical protein